MSKPVGALLSLAIFAAALGVRLSAQDLSQAGPGEVHVDQRCRVFVPGPGRQARYRYNKYMCHLESVHTSMRWEEVNQNGVVKHKLVRIREQEYILSGPSDAPVTFYVEHPLPRGGEVDSDPQPIAVENSVAIFEVQARPGQTVRLHVGVKD